MNKQLLLQKAKPLIFDTESVRAVLDGRKTTTRQVIKPQPEFAQTYRYKGKVLYEAENRTWCYKGYVSPDSWNEVDWILQFAPYKVGDILYVREACQEVYETEYDMKAEGYCVNIRTLIVNFDSIPKIRSGLSTGCSCSKMPPRNKYYVYKASNVEYSDAKNELRWRSPATMPKEAARIFLRVTGAKIERLQDITEADCLREGIRANFDGQVFYPEGYVFKQRWNSKIHKKDLDKYGWEANPYVWVYEFERAEVEK